MPSNESSEIPECEHITIATYGPSINITTDSELSFDVEVAVAIGAACRSVLVCRWDGTRWVCGNKTDTEQMD